MQNKYVVIGGVAAGMSAASRIRKADPQASVIVLEQGDHISYSACAMPYFIADPDMPVDELKVLSIEDARNKRKIDVRTRHRAIRIDCGKREAVAVHVDSGNETAFPYDRLVIATGASPVAPGVPGEDLPHVKCLRTLDDGIAIRSMLDSGHVTRSVILGGGFIGLEMCEALRTRNLPVTLVTSRSVPMAGLDNAIVRIIVDTLRENGVEHVADATARGITGKTVQLADRELEADLVVVGKGVRPNAALAEAAGIRLGAAGAIGVDERMETSEAGVYAAGDCAETLHRLMERRAYIPLGTVANKQGRVAGLSAAREVARFPGAISSTQLKLFDMELAHTGLTVEQAQLEGFDPVSIHITAPSAAHGYPERHPIDIVMIADKSTRRILGAQMIGRTGVAHRINIIATAIFNGNRADEFAMFDLAYAPPFAPVWDPVLVAANVLAGKLDVR